MSGEGANKEGVRRSNRHCQHCGDRLRAQRAPFPADYCGECRRAIAGEILKLLSNPSTGHLTGKRSGYRPEVYRVVAHDRGRRRA